MTRLKNFLWRGKLRKAATIVVGGFVVLVVIGAIASAFEEEKKDGASEPPAASRSSETLTPEPTETAEPTKAPKATTTVKPTSTAVPPTTTAVPLDQRPEAEAIRQTIHSYFNAHNSLVAAVQSGAQTNAIPILRLVDDRADAECGGIVAHGYAYVLMAQQMRERWEVDSIFDNEYDELDAEKGTAWVTVQLSSFDIDTGEPVTTEWRSGFHFKTDDLSPTGWVFTAGEEDTDLHYADGHQGPVYDPLVWVVSFCSR